MANPQDLRELEKDPRLFLYTSLTAGSSHIITATSRLETILKANKIQFQAIDIATDELHRKLWQRRAGQRKLPGLVKDGYIIGDLEEIEEWNEYGELKENIGPIAGGGAAAVPAPKLPVNPTATAGTTNVTAKPVIDTSKKVALPGAAEIKARNNPLPISSPEEATHPETMTSAPAEKQKSIEKSIKFKGDLEKQSEHLNAPPSEIPSKVATPESADASTAAVVAPAEAKDESSQTGLNTEKTTVPDPAAAGDAVETGDIDEPEIASTTIAAKSEPEHVATTTKSTDTPAEDSEAQPTVSATAARQSPVNEAEEGVESLKIANEESETQTQAAADPSAATESVED